MPSSAKNHVRPEVQWYAIFGAVAVIAGVSLYKAGNRPAGTVLFPLGWVLVAMAINRSNYGQNEMITYAGAALIVAGAGAARLAMDKKQQVPMWASALFLMGWLVIAAAAGGYSPDTENKELLSYLGAALVVGGAMYTASLEKRGASQTPGKLVFMMGWFVLVLGISQP
jgi:FtsH-binding integral membrane protein